MIDLRTFLVVVTVLSPMLPAAMAQDSADAETGAEDAAAAEPPESVVEDVIIVTASRTEQSMHEVPAAFTVITAEQIENAPADDYGDLLRNVPGLNVSQFSARDINVSSRQATNSLATDQLVLLDGRTLYLDFFGFVMWDFLPVNPRELKQIEVVRGPGSAVWGANALTGVINLITKSPREIVGTSLTVGGGELDTVYGSLTHAGVHDRLGYKLSLGYYQQDAYDRPTGLVPGTSTPYPAFPNSGTEQPKVDLRFDLDRDDTLWSFSGGWAGTDGIVHTGIGPFDIDTGSSLGYFKTSWSKRAMNANFFINLLDGDGSNLLTRGPDGRPLLLGFESQTYNLDFANTSVLGNDRHVVTYGFTARQNDFDLSIAAAGDDRQEFGVFLQDEILIGDKARWLIGARWDDMDPIGSVVSPRTSFLFSPTPDHTFRVSYNQAYRAPSVIENFLDTAIVNQTLIDPALIAAAIAPGVPCPFVLSTCDPFLYVFPSAAVGNPGLAEEALEAYEVGFVGSFGPTTLSLSVYRSELEDQTDFFTAANYSSTNPPPGWPVFLAGTPIPVVPPNTFPSVFSYRNVGQTINKGVELSIDVRPSAAWRFNLNYSYQEEPEVTGKPIEETNLPPENRFNAGVSYNGARFFANGNVNYADGAFWTDVLDARFHGPTDAYTQVNVGFGFHFLDDRATFSILGGNIFDEDVQQHVFGDIIGRKISAEFRFHW